jgi:hypothetical protein
MRTIVVAGARSGVGKTALSQKITVLIPGSRHVKIGHGHPKKGKTAIFYKDGTGIERILDEQNKAACLVIESNSILKSFSPDLCIYLGADNPKHSAYEAEKRADIVRGKMVDASVVDNVSRRLNMDGNIVRKIAELAGAIPPRVR